MADDTISALGPIFGPNFIMVTVNDDTNTQYQVELYPDANNVLLKANGLATQYYFMPQRVYLAKKQDSPGDFDFGMTVFKGLMTSETTVGVTGTTGGTEETGGGFGSFSTTFAIPDSVIANIIKLLKNKDYPAPPASSAGLFNHAQNDPDPVVGIVSILENDVTIEVPHLQGTGNANTPYYIDAQGTGKGSIEAQGISSFLVTCNELAAGAIVGSLQAGMSPFTVHYNLKLMFYINACDIHVIIDVDKVFDQFSASVSAGTFGDIFSASLSANYQSCVISGAIKTIMNMNNAEVPDDLKQQIEQQAEEMQQNAFNLVKSYIFDWTPTPDPPATGDRSFFSSLFGGASVSLKTNYQRRSIVLTQDFTLNGTIAVYDTVSGDLNDLEPAIKANLSKYLAIVDIGQYFQKIQIAGRNNFNWSELLSDGTNLADPITSAQFEVSYPDYSSPMGANKQPNLQTQASGSHYLIGQSNPSQSGALAAWNANNPNDIINISFLRLDTAVPGWDADQVQIQKTIVFNGEDPRVELASGGTTFTTQFLSKDHAPVITLDEVGYIYVRFMLDRVLPKGNITLTLTCTLGSRKDTLTITQANQKNVIWEIFSDKYLNQASFQYDLQVEVTGSNFTDTPVQYGTTQSVTVPLPSGRIKYINPYKLELPAPPPDQVTTINGYIKNYTSS